jgi:group I intron endonuclease
MGEMKNIPGVYMIRNTATDERYVGQAKDIALRWAKHRYALNKGIHRSKYLQRSWDKHGESVFEFAALEMLSFPLDKAALTACEQKWMDLFRPAYNSCPAADSWLGSRHSEETKAKLSRLNKGRKLGPHSEEHRRKIGDSHRGRKNGPLSHETKQKLSMAGLGRKMSAESRAKLSSSKKGWVPPPLSEEHKRKLSFAGKTHSKEVKRNLSLNRAGSGNSMYGKSGSDSPRAKPVQCIDDGRIYSTVTSAANWLKEHGYPSAVVGNISACCKGKLKTSYGRVWRYVEPERI